MPGCYSILECYNLFSGVKLSIRSSCFIFVSFFIWSKIRTGCNFIPLQFVNFDALHLCIETYYTVFIFRMQSLYVFMFLLPSSRTCFRSCLGISGE